MFPLLDRELNYVESVLEQFLFNFDVSFGFDLERGCVVDLQQPWFQFLVQYNVETQKFVTAIRLLLLTRPVNVLQLRLRSQDSLHYDRLDVLPYGVGRPHSRVFARLGGRLAHGSREHLR